MNLVRVFLISCINIYCCKFMIYDFEVGWRFVFFYKGVL